TSPDSTTDDIIDDCIWCTNIGTARDKWREYAAYKKRKTAAVIINTFELVLRSVGRPAGKDLSSLDSSDGQRANCSQPCNDLAGQWLLHGHSGQWPLLLRLQSGDDGRNGSNDDDDDHDHDHDHDHDNEGECRGAEPRAKCSASSSPKRFQATFDGQLLGSEEVVKLAYFVATAAAGRCSFENDMQRDGFLRLDLEMRRHAQTTSGASSRVLGTQCCAVTALSPPIISNKQCPQSDLLSEWKCHMRNYSARTARGNDGVSRGHFMGGVLSELTACLDNAAPVVRPSTNPMYHGGFLGGLRLRVVPQSEAYAYSPSSLAEDVWRHVQAFPGRYMWNKNMAFLPVVSRDFSEFIPLLSALPSAFSARLLERDRRLSLFALGKIRYLRYDRSDAFAFEANENGSQEIYVSSIDRMPDVVLQVRLDLGVDSGMRQSPKDCVHNHGLTPKEFSANLRAIADQLCGPRLPQTIPSLLTACLNRTAQGITVAGKEVN
ncbi:unnamed protein product, partial [Soboliphyme baturini]|uniref:Mediator of RNA polymerase II transcription subunit 13 n=1 Tax=Soboliphyme baturini TaxID=241478 RepID=A0A183J3N4_9BILA